MEINKKKTLTLLCFIFFTFGVSTSSIDPIIPIIADELKVGFDLIGIALFAGFVFSLISNFLAGRLGDRIDTKKIIITGLILIMAGLLFFGLYITFALFILYLIIIRSGYGALDASVYTYVSQFYHKDVSSIFVRLNLLWYGGSVLGPLFIGAALFLNINPRLTFIPISASFVILAILFYKIAPAKKHDGPASPEKKKNENFLTIIRNPVIITSGLVLFFYAGSIFGLSAWLTTYFTAFGIKVSWGSMILSSYWVFSIIGLYMTNWLLKKTNEITIIFVGFIIGVICISIVAISPSITVKLVFLMLQALFLAGIFPLAKSIPINENPHASGTIIGFVLLIQGIGIMIFQPVLGFFAENLGRDFTVYVVLAGLVLALIFTSLLFFFLNKKYGTRLTLSR